MSKIYNKLGNLMKCPCCHKELDTNMELEYSDEINTLCCCPDCATTIYYEDERSRPVDKTDLEKLGYVIDENKQ